MAFQSINPADGTALGTLEPWGAAQLETALRLSAAAAPLWAAEPVDRRCQCMANAAAVLRAGREEYARTITREMGKLIGESRAEIDKCAWACDYYAEHGPEFLTPEAIPTDAVRSYVCYQPLGTVLGVMPWNFPFWQVMRFAAPALMAGNTGILKHASNVPQCALALEEIFRISGFPPGVFRTLLIPGSEASRLAGDPRIAAVTLTGSDLAGAQVAEAAGRALKKCVLELGGSDAFIVLEDADLVEAAEVGVRARFQNAGQSCIAAKRFIVAEKVFDEFRDRFVEAARGLLMGDPMDEQTQIGPLARGDLRDDLEAQVRRSVAQGARILLGGERRSGRGYFFPPTVVAGLTPGMPLAREEVFGPVAALMCVRDAEEAVQVANRSAYGLGCSLWTRDLDRARRLARDIEAGMVFVNGMVVSDPRLPFGGVKRSGYGRELSEYGIREFVNIQTVWIGPRVS